MGDRDPELGPAELAGRSADLGMKCSPTMTPLAFGRTLGIEGSKGLEPKLMKHHIGQTDAGPGCNPGVRLISQPPTQRQGKVRTRRCAPPQRLNAPVRRRTKRAPLCGRNIRRPPHKMAARLRVSGLFSSNGNLPFFRATRREVRTWPGQLPSTKCYPG